MRPSNQAHFIPWRFYFILVIILLIVAGLSLRLLDLAVLEHHFLQSQGDARSLRMTHSPLFRGMIVDRNGNPLAISTTVFAVWVNPKKLALTSQQYNTLSTLLEMPSKNLTQFIQQQNKQNGQKKQSFLFLKHGVSPDIAKKIKAEKMPGVFLQEEGKRFYPEGEVTAQLLGFTNLDDRGQEGLELIYDAVLSPKAEKKIVIKDRLGRSVSSIKEVSQGHAGQDVYLSIDNRIQYMAYRELMAGIAENKALSGSIVVLDIKTGEVLAMANLPSFNPNRRVAADRNAFRNRAVTDVFEPGSTIKSFSIASALSSGRFTPETVIDNPGWIRVDHNIVRDEHSKGPMTVRNILQVSSNVGVTKMVLTLPPNTLWDMLHRVGFGEKTESGFPGERSGSLVKQKNWKPFALATLSFGYGMSATTLQLARAYAVLANEGIKMPISLTKQDTLPTGERILDPALTAVMLNLLESVTATGGTATAAQVPGYRVAGKTGTALLAGKGGYHEKRYISSFVGIAPATHPRLVIAVVLNEPHGKQYYGGIISAPVFARVMAGALRVMNVPPDNI